jgi:hypothetical protein
MFEFVKNIVKARDERAVSVEVRYRELIQKAAASTDGKLNAKDTAELDSIMDHLKIEPDKAHKHVDALQRHAELTAKAKTAAQHDRADKSATDAVLAHAEETEKLKREHAATLAERAQSHEQLRSVMNAAAAAKREAESAGDEAKAIARENWQLMGLPDPAIADTRRAEAEADADRVRPRTIGHGINKRDRERVFDIHIENLFDGFRPAGFENMTFVRADDQDASDFGYLLDVVSEMGKAPQKRWRYLQGDDVVLDFMRFDQRELILKFHNAKASIESGAGYDPDRYSYAPLPGQSSHKLNKMVKELRELWRGHSDARDHNSRAVLSAVVQPAPVHVPRW